jgi:hypothetical protein
MGLAKLRDEFLEGFADAVTDIRQKVVEEPMYGRAVTDGQEGGPRWPEAEPEPSFGTVTRTIDVGPTHDQIHENANYRLAAMERELNSPEWPQADQSHSQRIEHEREQNCDIDLDR